MRGTYFMQNELFLISGVAHCALSQIVATARRRVIIGRSVAGIFQSNCANTVRRIFTEQMICIRCFRGHHRLTPLPKRSLTEWKARRSNGCMDREATDAWSEATDAWSVHALRVLTPSCHCSNGETFASSSQVVRWTLGSFCWFADRHRGGSGSARHRCKEPFAVRPSEFPGASPIRAQRRH